MQAPMSDEQALAHQKQVDNQMAEAIKQNPASLDQAVQEYGDDAPSFIKHMIDVAAENQDEELLEILKPYAEKFNIVSFRCGGKVRAKIKKACGGKKMEKGGEAPIKKEAKGWKPCPCTLKKVGGKLIEVDCEGIPVAKNGSVLYAQPGNRLLTQEEVNQLKRNSMNGVLAITSNLKFPDLSKPKITTGSMQIAVQPELKQVSKEAIIGERPNNELSEVTVVAQRPQETWRQRFEAGKVKFGGLTKAEALARQNEMLAAEGFNANLGRFGADGMWGKTSQSEWNRYQEWKKQQQELANLKAQNASIQRLEAPIVQPTAVKPEIVPLTLDGNRNIVNLNTITPGEALHLRDEEWNKWLQNKFPRLEISNRPIFAGYLPGYKEGSKLNYYKYLQSGGNIPNTHSYKSQSRAEQNIPEETLIDRTGKNPRYTYVPGELKSNLHFKVPTAVPNTEKILGPNEKRMYIDPKTNRVYEIQGREDPNMSFVNYTWSGSPVDQEFDNIGQRPVVGGTQFELSGQDVYLFPNGQVNSVSRSNSTTPIPQPPIIPRIGHVPTNPTDNTSTRGSFEMGDWGNVKGGNYPGTQLPIPAPEGYDPYSQYEKRIDQVNGGTRITYIDKRTGKILIGRPQV